MRGGGLDTYVLMLVEWRNNFGRETQTSIGVYRGRRHIREERDARTQRHSPQNFQLHRCPFQHHDCPPPIRHGRAPAEWTETESLASRRRRATTADRSHGNWRRRFGWTILS
ncbi:hypothetical protein BT93_E1810 [Corymbia citriodora subsp. variegata]|nr:hypothetical protein BT93_E1810 [Corymbia citriodora subsp. variegata]